MQRHLYLILLITFIFLSTPTLAQQDTSSTFGFGVNFAKDLVLVNMGMSSDISFASLPYDFANFSLIYLSGKFRLETKLGYFRYAYDYSSNQVGGGSSESRSSNWRVGATLAVNKQKEDFRYYYGIYLGFIFSSYERIYSSEYDNDTINKSKTDFLIGPVFGGEHMFSDHFSLGGELQLNYVSIGQYKDKDAVGEESSERSESALSTRAVIVLRCYF